MDKPIYGVTVGTPLNPKKISGGASATVDQTYDPTSKNAQSGIAIAAALENEQDKFVEILHNGIAINGIRFDYPWVTIKTGDDEGAELFLGEIHCSINKPFMVGKPILPDGTLLEGNYAVTVDLMNEKIGDIETALENIIAKQQFFNNGATITITDNTEYIAKEEITNLTIVYPDTDFICSFSFTLASEGDITITLPESKYIGGTPSFANGETWELNIKNGVVVGGLVE